jgi:NAD(P)-dependent dehydrogenase (short-subunit alcohol dehydrogenase family)
MNECSFSIEGYFLFFLTSVNLYIRGVVMGQKLAGKVVFVTGASSGIGEGLAREAAGQGAAVVLAARRIERTARLAAELEATGGRALAVRCDVTRDGELEEAVACGLERFGRLDVAIANAGISINGCLADLTVDDFRRQLDTNVLGVVRTVKATLPALTASRGALGLLGSTNGYLSLPGYSPYSASKHAVRALADCLRHELGSVGVSVTHIAPGFIESELRVFGNDGSPRPDPIPRWLQLSAPRAARQMLRAIQARRAEAIITGHAWLAIFVARHAPWLISAGLRIGRGALMKAARQA